jgi:AcrR family transcriptional regulator
VVEIAEAAGFSKNTVFNYFPRKEDMFLDLQPEAEELLARAVRERPPGQSVLEAVRVLMHRLLVEKHPLSGVLPPHMAKFGRMLAESPALRSRAREQRDELAASVASLVAEETGDVARAALIGDLLLSAIAVVVTIPIKRLLQGHRAAAVLADQPGVIDQSFDLLATGIGNVGTTLRRGPGKKGDQPRTRGKRRAASDVTTSRRRG